MRPASDSEAAHNRVLLVQAGSNSLLYPFRSHPLGLMYLASSLRRALPRSEVRIINMKVQPFRPEDIAGITATEDIDIVGIGGFSVHSDIMSETARLVRKASPRSVVIAGGPHAAAARHLLLDNGLFDAVAVGESEESFIEAAKNISMNKSISTIPGILCEGNQGVFAFPQPLDPDDIPFPAWDLIDFDDYSRVSSFSIMGRRRYMSLFTSRGCPFKCFYCHNIFGKQFRGRSSENVLCEIKELIETYGIRDFDILDDVFNFDKARVRKICEGILSTGKKITMAFPNGLRSDALDDDTLEIMRRAGTIYISFAIESAEPRIQKLMGKNLAIQKAEKAIRAASRLGIFCNGFFMLGFPTEKEHELSKTISFALKSQLHTAHFLKVTAFSGTDLFDSLDDDNKRLVSQTPDSGKYYDRSYNLSEIENTRFNSLLAAAHKRFYINPLRLIRMAIAHPFKANLLRFAAFAVRRIIFASEKG